MRHVFFDPMRSGEDSFMLFSCASIMRPGDKRASRYDTSNDLSPLFAAIKNFAKCAVVMEVCNLAKTEVERTEACKYVQNAIHGRSDARSLYVMHCLKTFLRFQNSEIQSVRFAICPFYSSWGIIHGHEITIGTLGEKIRSKQTKAWVHIQANLVYDLKHSSEFWK